jgi:hypothetical protein
MRESALDRLKEKEDRQGRRQQIMLVATIVAALGAWTAAVVAYYELVLIA